ncbi:energy transducer TonB family protein [Parvularcula oceani]|uniref:energy transducer TonB family protein n=1 Tax=Parvularcula oceani TaxID=1247963 RepID=UPI0004E1619A|nr:energy transducer TonB [Parvularcula oceani]
MKTRFILLAGLCACASTGEPLPAPQEEERVYSPVAIREPTAAADSPLIARFVRSHVYDETLMRYVPRPEDRPYSGEFDDVIASRSYLPLVRFPPQDFENCRGSAKASVHLRFDVLPSGRTGNIEIVDSTDACYGHSAAEAVGRWLYQPARTREGGLTVTGVETTVSFDFQS